MIRIKRAGPALRKFFHDLDLERRYWQTTDASTNFRGRFQPDGHRSHVGLLLWRQMYQQIVRQIGRDILYASQPT